MPEKSWRLEAWEESVATVATTANNHRNLAIRRSTLGSHTSQQRRAHPIVVIYREWTPLVRIKITFYCP